MPEGSVHLVSKVEWEITQSRNNVSDPEPTCFGVKREDSHLEFGKNIASEENRGNNTENNMETDESGQWRKLFIGSLDYRAAYEGLKSRCARWS